MIEDHVLFGSQEYLLYLSLLVFARGMDFLSTWIASPTLALEANPIAKWLRWRWGAAVNLVMCFVLAFLPLPAIIISTTSVLVAARNFQVAWLMRAAGESNYRFWVAERLDETPIGLFVFCLFAQTLLVALVGLALMLFSGWHLVTLGIGMGIVAYAVAVTVFTLISLWRNRRAMR